MTTFLHDEKVDVVIRGALVDWHGEDGQLCISLPGVDEQIIVPTRDDEGARLAVVTVSRAEVFSSVPVAESVEVAHGNGNHAWCDHGVVPGYRFDQLIELDDATALPGASDPATTYANDGCQPRRDLLTDLWAIGSDSCVHNYGSTVELVVVRHNRELLGGAL